MASKEQDLCCGNCQHFDDEDMDGFGWCHVLETASTCAACCPCHDKHVIPQITNTNNRTEVANDVYIARKPV